MDVTIRKQRVTRQGAPGGLVVLPADATIVHAGLDADNEPSIWFTTDPTWSAPFVQRRFATLFTGDRLPAEELVAHLGTCHRGPFFMHIVELAHSPGEGR